MPEISEQVFKDLTLRFTAHPVTGDVPILYNTEAVKRAIKNLILTNRYERLYQPNMGGDVYNQLFENFDSFTEHILRKNIRLAIQNYEPRAEVLDINVEANGDDQVIRIRVVFRVVNSTEPAEVDFLVERMR